VTIKTDVFDALQALVDGRCHPSHFPQESEKPTWPAIRIAFSLRNVDDDLCGDSDDDTADLALEVDICALDYDECQVLRGQVRVIMKAFSPPAILESDFSAFDPDSKTERVVLEYTIYPSSPAV